jgi:hypothetical protein
MVDIVSKWAASNITSPGYSFSAITPSDSVDEAKGPFKAIYVGVGGDIAIVGLDNAAVTFKGAVTGSIIPVIGRRVNSTNTAATDMVGIR